MVAGDILLQHLEQNEASQAAIAERLELADIQQVPWKQPEVLDISDKEIDKDDVDTSSEQPSPASQEEWYARHVVVDDDDGAKRMCEATLEQWTSRDWFNAGSIRVTACLICETYPSSEANDRPDEVG